MSYYRYHVFFCTNQRVDQSRSSCANCSAAQLLEYLKVKIKKSGLSGKGKIRVSSSGCLDRCEEGPVLVIYPEETWYTYLDESDIDEIIDSHLLKGIPVERLKLS